MFSKSNVFVAQCNTLSNKNVYDSLNWEKGILHIIIYYVYMQYFTVKVHIAPL